MSEQITTTKGGSEFEIGQYIRVSGHSQIYEYAGNGVFNPIKLRANRSPKRKSKRINQQQKRRGF